MVTLFFPGHKSDLCTFIDGGRDAVGDETSTRDADPLAQIILPGVAFGTHYGRDYGLKVVGFSLEEQGVEGKVEKRMVGPVDGTLHPSSPQRYRVDHHRCDRITWLAECHAHGGGQLHHKIAVWSGDGDAGIRAVLAQVASRAKQGDEDEKRDRFHSLILFSCSVFGHYCFVFSH